jgi:uncharacterized membrane protein
VIVSSLHLLALAAYLGAVVGLWAIVFPSFSTLGNHEARLKLLGRSLKIYNPVQCGALGVLVLTGAMQVTDLKNAYRDTFAQTFGATLGWKLSLAFFLILLSTYQSMGVALRFVRRSDAGEAITPAELDSIVKRLRGSTVPLLLLSAATIWLGLQLRH